MYLCGANYESIADGICVRTTLFISGCLHNCYKCQSPQTHSFTYGREVDEKMINQINSEIKKRPFLSGITLSGGDCMYSPLETLKLIKKLYIPHNNIWCYTGFTYEKLLQNSNQYQLLKEINVLVDGKFDFKNRDVTLLFRGSANQRIIDVQQSITNNEIILWKDGTA
jgi:anaerobic ribonucleoside-triphosphate reductase activating protein